jgi:hypothetical protein
MVRSEFQRACEHEAAHAVVSWAVGADVSRIVVYRDGSGEVNGTRADPAAHAATIAAAGDLWDAEFSGLDYVDGSCADLQMQLERSGCTGFGGHAVSPVGSSAAAAGT